MCTFAKGSQKIAETIGETHCVSCQSWLPLYPHDSRPTLKEMQKIHKNKSESVLVPFVLLFYSGSAKYRLGLKSTHMQAELFFSSSSFFMIRI